MRLLIFVLALLLSCLLTYPAANAQTQPPGAPPSFADLAESLLPAVVNISSTQKMHPQIEMQPAPGMPPMQDIPQFPEGSPFEHFFEDFMNRRGPGAEIEPEASLGSGFIIDAEKGYIITNNHVIRDAEEVRVTFYDDVTLDAKIIGLDEKTDIAVLQVKTDKKLTAVKLGDSDKLRVGDWVVAIGNPFGLGGTVTAGIVSARARDINAGPYDDFIQTDASINRGNSGGPMFDLKGEVIGINTAIFSPSGGSVGIGFAIPSSLAKPTIDQLIQFGRTRRGWLGVRIQQVTEDIAESLGLPNENGALIASITPKGPSEAAGLKAGDVILELNGHKIDEMRELPRLVAETPISSDAKVTYWRDGKTHETSINVGELEKAEDDGLIETAEAEEMPINKPGKTVEPPGFTISALNETLRSSYGIGSDVEGVIITGVTPRSEVAKKGLYDGDVIVEINQTPVKSVAEVETLIAEAKKDGRGSILILLNREGDSRFIALKIDEKEKKKKK